MYISNLTHLKLGALNRCTCTFSLLSFSRDTRRLALSDFLSIILVFNDNYFVFVKGDFETIPMLKEECSCQPTCEYTTYEHTISSARGATINIPLWNQLEMVKDVYE